LKWFIGGGGLPKLMATNPICDGNGGCDDDDDAICNANTLSNIESIAEGEIINTTTRKTALIVRCTFIIILILLYFYDNNVRLLEEKEKEKNSECCYFVAL
jgi:hypothetical protein